MSTALLIRESKSGSVGLSSVSVLTDTISKENVDFSYGGVSPVEVTVSASHQFVMMQISGTAQGSSNGYGQNVTFDILTPGGFYNIKSASHWYNSSAFSFTSPLCVASPVAFYGGNTAYGGLCPCPASRYVSSGNYTTGITFTLNFTATRYVYNLVM